MVAVSAAVTQDTRPVKDSSALEECYSHCTPSHVSMAAAARYSFQHWPSLQYKLLTIATLSCFPHQAVNHSLHHWNILHQLLHLHTCDRGHCSHSVAHTDCIEYGDGVFTENTWMGPHCTHKEKEQGAQGKQMDEAAMPSAKCAYNVQYSSLVTLTI